MGKGAEIITFYSFKGGTGRSMAVANVAYLLARKGSVLAIDWDLDAPGLIHYLKPLLAEREPSDLEGVAELFQALGPTSLAGDSPNTLDSIDLQRFIVPTTIPNLSFMPAGRMDESYASRVAALGWPELYASDPMVFRRLAKRLADSYSYVLIDSRTGLSDTSGICTALMPEKLVVVFTPNRQSIQGGLMVIRQALEFRKNSDDLRPLVVFPLASRIETSEPALLESWRFAEPTSSVPLGGYQSLFEATFKDLYELRQCDLSAYFDNVQIQYVPRYSYGESIASMQERGDRLSLARSYATFADHIIAGVKPWDVTAGLSSTSPQVELQPRDLAWCQKHRKSAREGLQKLQLSGFAEAWVSIRTGNPSVDQARLLDAVRSAQIHAFGWPIGVVLEGDTADRPRPVQDGIVAAISFPDSTFGKIYDYWAFRRDGEFFLLQGLFEDTRQRPDSIFFDVRITRLVETLLFCSRVYKRLGVSSGAVISFTCRWSGLRGRRLVAADPMRHMMGSRESAENEAESSIDLPLSRISVDLVGVVKQLLEPLFVLFDFMRFSDQVYEQVVSRFVEAVRQESPAPLQSEAYRACVGRFRLFTERQGSKWRVTVYDTGEHVTIYESEKSDEASAKAEAVNIARLNSGEPKEGGEVGWERHQPPPI